MIVVMGIHGKCMGYRRLSLLFGNSQNLSTREWEGRDENYGCIAEIMKVRCVENVGIWCLFIGKVLHPSCNPSRPKSSINSSMNGRIYSSFPKPNWFRISPSFPPRNSRQGPLLHGLGLHGSFLLFLLIFAATLQWF